MRKWEKIGKIGDLTLEACGNRRRVVDSEGRIVDEYVE